MTEKPKRTYTRRVYAVVYRAELGCTSKDAPLFETEKLARESAIYRMFRKAVKIVPATITYSV